MADALLALNAGSSSFKFALFPAALPAGGAMPTATVRGEVEGIGSVPRLRARDARGQAIAERDWPGGAATTHEAVLGDLLDWIGRHLGADQLRAVGHRVVHGGAAHVAPALVTPALLDSLDSLVPLAPLHQPHNLAPIRAIAALDSRLPQVACFDTAFHHRLPAVAARLALPRRYAREGVRRYGFHGLSYEFIARRLAALDPALAQGRVVAAHLGNGASLCALLEGQSQDTTMGFTPLDGLVMGTRCGSLDPSVLLYLQRRHGLDADALERLLDQESGLLGVSELASDMRTLLASDDERAREAVALFVYRVACGTAAMAVALDGLDGLVFTGGIGEHAAPVRAAICIRLGWLGIVLDPDANARGEGRISTPRSQVSVLVVPTDEEAMIARHTLAAL